MCNTKICKRCGEEQSIDNFYKVPSMKDGHDNTCKACRKKLRRLRDGVKVEPLITEGVMVCPVCKRELSVDKFDTYAKSKTGRYWMCSDCYKEHTLINNGNDKNYFRKLRIKLCPEYKEEIYQQKKESRERNIEQAMLTSAKNRAARKGLEFNLELSDIVIPDVCPLLEVPFQFGTKDSYDYSPSLDRIDNSKGYIKGNVQVISMKANAMKNSASPDELHTFCKNILRHSPNCIE
jgi:hypothetical protein